MSIASEILHYYKLWEDTDKQYLVSQIEKYMAEAYPECTKQPEHRASRGAASALISRLMHITDSKKDSVYSWLNISREKVKIPFFKLCMLADALNVELSEFLLKEEQINGKKTS